MANVLEDNFGNLKVIGGLFTIRGCTKVVLKHE